jgi:hypothetical protein
MVIPFCKKVLENYPFKILRHISSFFKNWCIIQFFTIVTIVHMTYKIRLKIFKDFRDLLDLWKMTEVGQMNKNVEAKNTLYYIMSFLKKKFSMSTDLLFVSNQVTQYFSC